MTAAYPRAVDGFVITAGHEVNALSSTAFVGTLVSQPNRKALALWLVLTSTDSHRPLHSCGSTHETNCERFTKLLNHLLKPVEHRDPCILFTLGELSILAERAL